MIEGGGKNFGDVYIYKFYLKTCPLFFYFA